MTEEILERFTCKDGSEYGYLKTGAIKHLNPQPFTYDAAYSAIYDSPERVQKSDMLQALRFAFAQAAHGKRIQSLTDVGFGNGAFMRFAVKKVQRVMGLDITDVPVPEGCKRIESYQSCDVITFHDCLEHFNCLEFVKDLPCQTLVISLPYCHYHERGKEWFENKYFHRKPSEHIYHFSGASLAITMKDLGWQKVSVSDHEDIVRQREGEEWNILSMAFKRP